uniref:Uncharacterized protein n=1 Tax=Arundo donax TaxID=35708 RepID=A0A0A9GTK1_ARUDO
MYTPSSSATSGEARRLSSREPVNPCEKTILYRAFSLGTPDSSYARCRPSLSLTRRAVTGGPPGVPHTRGAGGCSTARQSHPTMPIGS